MSANVAEAPFACDAGDVATAVVKGLHRGSSVVWAPAVLQGMFGLLRYAPGPIWRRLDRSPMTVERQPALDGVRALALVLVLFFHAGYSWMPAGYMGVSVFFTLSGYLITNLLLTEFDASHGIRLGTFYSRRWKRLLPAGLLCLVGIVLLRFAGAFGEVQHLRGDLTAATLQFFNWTELSRGTSYADLFTASADQLSPVKHYWSLAIEEQFYLLWPVVLLLLARRARRAGVSVLWPVGALTAVFVIAAPVIGRVFGADAAYWATPARFGEILVGATLACVMRSPWASGRAPSAPVGTALAAGCLAVIVTSAVVLPSDGGPAFDGWLGIFALASAGLIVGLQAPGPLRRVLSWRPLVLLGLVSYGAYLFHWPVFVVLSSRGWSLSSSPSFAVAVAITLALAAVSYRLVEHPIRVRSWSPGRVGGAAIAASVATLVAVLVAPPSSGGFLVADEALLDSAAIQPVEPFTELETVTELEPVTERAVSTLDDPACSSDADPGRGPLARPCRPQCGADADDDRAADRGADRAASPPPAGRWLRPRPSRSQRRRTVPSGFWSSAIPPRSMSVTVWRAGPSSTRAWHRSTCSGARGSVSSPAAPSRPGTAPRSWSARSRCSTRICPRRSIVCSPTWSC